MILCIPVPRTNCWGSDRPYFYIGIHHPNHWSDIFTKLRDVCRGLLPQIRMLVIRLGGPIQPMQHNTPQYSETAG